MKTLKAVKIGFTNAAVLLAILVIIVLAAAIYLSGYFIPMPEMLRLVSGVINLAGNGILGILLIAIIIYNRKADQLTA